MSVPIWVQTVCKSYHPMTFVITSKERVKCSLEASQETTNMQLLKNVFLENYKNIGFLSNSGPDPLTNNKATKQAFKVASL